jgi:hypothetical protein
MNVEPFVGPDGLLLSAATLLSYKLTYEITTVKRAATTRLPPPGDANFYNVGVNEFPPAARFTGSARAPPGSSHGMGG